MPDRARVIKGLEHCLEGVVGCQKRCPYKRDFSCRSELARDALTLLKEQDEERKRLISWMGKFCAHVDTDFQPMQDEENTRFFCEKMRTQFGWEVSGEPDREKVIKGLECHQEPYGCPKCPYWDREMPLKDCENNKLIADALALLREQEPVETDGDNCGECGYPLHRINYDGPDKGIRHEWFRFCPSCGKEAKWK